MPSTPGRPAGIAATMTQQERRHLLALTAQILHGRLTGPGQIAHRLVEGVGHPHRRQLAGAVQLGQAHGIAPVGLDPLTGPLRDQRGCHHRTVLILDLAVKSVPCRPGFVAEVQMIVLLGQPAHQLARGRRRVLELPQVAHFAATTVLGNRDGILRLRDIQTNKGVPISGHGSSPIHGGSARPTRATLVHSCIWGTSRLSRLADIRSYPFHRLELRLAHTNRL